MIASLVFDTAYRRFQAACHNPLAAQAARLRRILWQARHTEAGQAFGFGSLSRTPDSTRMIATFQERVPVRTHAAMATDLNAVHHGDWRRLCPSIPLYFSMTAGSTGRFKFIPVTAEYRREIGTGSLIYYGALQAAYPRLRRLKAQFLVGSAEGGTSPGGRPQGFASGFNYRRLPLLLRHKFLLPYWIFTLEDPEDRSYAAGRLLAGNPRLGALCAISPVNLINLRNALEHNAERLIRDIATGTLTVLGRAALPGRAVLPPDPGLAARLREAWQETGRLPDRLLFPSLEVLVCWQGGNMSYYLPELDRAFALDRHFEFPVSASEGVFAIPTRADRAGGTLAITSHFLEFLPESGCGPVLRSDQLRQGDCYRIVVTNSGGLYRYDMEDLVRVQGFTARTPVIEFIAKAGRQVSVANERLTERDVTVAMERACRRWGYWPPRFLFVPCSDRRYRVLLDRVDLPAGICPDWFGNEVDRQLRESAKGYGFEREDALLGPLQLMITAPGVLRRYLADQQGTDPLPNAQRKPQHLATAFDLHRTLFEEGGHAA